MNNKYIIIAIVGILIVGAGIYFFKDKEPSDEVYTPTTNSNDNSTPKNPAPVINQVVHNISIVGSAFVPSSITVRKGETIVWTNKDTMPHTVTGGDLKSLSLAQNQTYSFTYDKTGTFSYHCDIHPSMKGTVTVTN